MGPSRINPLLCLLAATLVIRALRERREGSPLRLPDRIFHDLGGSCAHIARHPPRSWKPGVPSRSKQRVNHLRAPIAGGLSTLIMKAGRGAGARGAGAVRGA